MNRFLVYLLCLSLLFTAGICNTAQAQEQQEQYFLELQGFTWNQTTIRSLIVTSENESWWNPIFVNATVRAVNIWSDAIQFFAINYSDFSYLSNLKLESAVSNETLPGFDIYFTWTESPLRNTTDEVGLARTVTNAFNVVVNCTINLVAKTNHGYALSEGDIQNVALHEFGHSLGLGHSNYTGDLMFPMYTLRGSNQGISTLDVYGVATVFQWIPNPSEFFPVNRWLQRTVINLPSDIPYQYMAVSPENVRPQSFEENPVVQVFILMWELLLHPEILIIVVIFILVFVIIGLIPRRRPKREAEQINSSQPADSFPASFFRVAS